MLEFSDKAIADLAQISIRIAADNPGVAIKKAAMLAATCELLDAFPGLGALFVAPYRIFTKELWVILYRPTASGVYISRVFDSRQDWRSQLG